MNALTSGESLMMGGVRDEISMLKARRNKKHLTAAQAQGKVTGRWTEEEHERFNEGKFESIQIFHLLMMYQQSTIAIFERHGIPTH